MSYMKGDLLTKTRNLVKGLAKTEPLWLKAMEKFGMSSAVFKELLRALVSDRIRESREE